MTMNAITTPMPGRVCLYLEFKSFHHHIDAGTLMPAIPPVSARRMPDRRQFASLNVKRSQINRDAVVACSAPTTAQTSTVIPIREQCPVRCLDDHDNSPANGGLLMADSRRVAMIAPFLVLCLTVASHAEDW